MRRSLTVAVIALAVAFGPSPVSAQTRGTLIIFPDVPRRHLTPWIIRSLDGVRNGTTRYERDQHGGLGGVDLSGRPELRELLRHY
jgi:hypothetical protein